MITIEITGLNRYDSYFELSYKMRFTLPAIYGTGANPIKGLPIILQSYKTGYSVGLEGIDTIIEYSNTESYDNGLNVNNIKSKLTNQYNKIRTNLDSLTLKSYDTISGLAYNGSSWI